MSHTARSLIAAFSAAALTLLAAPTASAVGSLGTGPTGPGVAAANVSAPVEAPQSPTGPDAAMLGRVLELTNAYRVAHGLPAVRYDSRLQTVAEDWSAHMADAGVMSHNPDLRALYPAGWTGFAENVLQNWDDATAEQLVQQWIDSPPHRAAMLNPDYTHVGLGYAIKDDHRVYATQDYARY